MTPDYARFPDTSAIRGRLPANIIDVLRRYGDNYEEWAKRLTDNDCVILDRLWRFWARAGQVEPPGDWRVWLMMAGRGFGKTRSGAEWIRERAEAGDTTTRIAIVAATANDARAVMVEGNSGLLAIAPPETRPGWEPSRGVLVWATGAVGQVYSAQSPERLRGPEHDYAWCDEMGAWSNVDAAWANLHMGLRRGDRPRALVTTTPRALPLLRTLIKKKNVARTGGRTADNPLLHMADIVETYGGTAFGRQELDGELIETIVGAMWTRAALGDCRVATAPPFKRVVVGVDPSASVGGDACGIVVVGLGVDDIAYVIEDATVSGVLPEGWASVVKAMKDKHAADRVVAEVNNGGDMVASVLFAADDGLPLKQVRAAHNKTVRAEPVSLLYTRGRVRHVGRFDALEDEMCGLLTAGGYVGPGRSPDRADALVWALTELMLGDKQAEPRVRVV